MVTSNSRLAYQDCIDLMDQAIANKRGVRVQFLNEGLAAHFRMRLHAARVIDRNDNAEAYDDKHKLHGRSVYDALVMRNPRNIDGGWWLYIEKHSIEELKIEALSEEEEAAPVVEPAQSVPVAADAITIFDEPKPLRRL